MTIAEVLLLDLDAEVARTRQTFDRVPDDNAAWKPHERSLTLGQLAKHIAQLPYFGELFLTTDFMDVTGPPRPSVFISKEDLFTTLDASVAALRNALAAASDEYLMQQWAFRAGDKVLDSEARARLYRTMFLNHFIHHRAQLGVYLRLLNIPIPGLYGPSADEPWNPS